MKVLDPSTSVNSHRDINSLDTASLGHNYTDVGNGLSASTTVRALHCH